MLFQELKRERNKEVSNLLRENNLRKLLEMPETDDKEQNIVSCMFI